MVLWSIAATLLGLIVAIFCASGKTQIRYLKDLV